MDKCDHIGRGAYQDGRDLYCDDCGEFIRTLPDTAKCEHWFLDHTCLGDKARTLMCMHCGETTHEELEIYHSQAGI